MRYGIVSLQSVARGAMSRVEIKHASKACIVIQQSWRGYHARAQYCEDMLKIVDSQSIVRRKLCVMSYNNKKAAARMIQYAFQTWRLNQCRKEYYAAVVIQSTIRGTIARDNLFLLGFAAKIIQKIQ